MTVTNRESNLTSNYTKENGQDQSYSDEYYTEDYDSELYDSEEESVTDDAGASSIGAGTMDTEYEDFVENFGHYDFQHLNFLPKIKTKQELVKEHFKRQ